MIAYGIISYVLLILLIIGYFVVKKWGDKQITEGDYGQFNE
jgi:uncharacterized protein YneF (UPF0154 family)